MSLSLRVRGIVMSLPPKGSQPVISLPLQGGGYEGDGDLVAVLEVSFGQRNKKPREEMSRGMIGCGHKGRGLTRKVWREGN